MLDGLEIGDTLPELDSIFGVLHSLLKRGFGKSTSAHSHADSSHVQRLHGYPETSAFLSKQVFRWHPAILEYKFAVGLSMEAHLFFVFAKGKARSALFHYERAHTTRSSPRPRLHGHNVSLRLTTVADEDFCAIKYVLIPILYGGSQTACGIGACVRFSQTKSANSFALSKGNEVFTLLLLRTEHEQRIDTEYICSIYSPCCATCSGYFFTHQRPRNKISAQSPIFLRYGYTSQIILSQKFDIFPGEFAFFVDFVSFGRKFLLAYFSYSL